jgi:hypothetical protein
MYDHAHHPRWRTFDNLVRGIRRWLIFGTRRLDGERTIGGWFRGCQDGAIRRNRPRRGRYSCRRGSFVLGRGQDRSWSRRPNGNWSNRLRNRNRYGSHRPHWLRRLQGGKRDRLSLGRDRHGTQRNRLNGNRLLRIAVSRLRILRRLAVLRILRWVGRRRGRPPRGRVLAVRVRIRHQAVPRRIPSPASLAPSELFHNYCKSISPKK